MPPTAEGFTSQGSYVPDALIAGEYPRATRMVTITGGNFVRGTLMGVITASGKYTKSIAASNDGSEVPDSILDADTDASGGDKTAVVNLTGEFNEAGLVFGAGHTIASVRQGLRKIGIFLRKVVAA